MVDGVGDSGVSEKSFQSKIDTGYNPGCCSGRSCTLETCGKLPEGKTCADCVFSARCSMIFGVDPDNTVCDFIPRRFRERKEKER